MSNFLHLLFAGHSGAYRFNGKETYLTYGKRSPEVGEGIGIHEGVFDRLVCEYIDQHSTVDTCFVNSGVDNMTQARRVELANDIHKRTGKKTILLVVHANAAGEPGWSSAHGCKTFHAITCSSRSKLLAGMIDDEFIDAGHSSRGVSARNLWILRRTHMPAVLFETDFMTNKKSAAFMASTEGVNYFGDHLSTVIERFDELHN